MPTNGDFQLLAVNAHKMAPRTTPISHNNPWDNVVTGWRAVGGGAELRQHRQLRCFLQVRAPSPSLPLSLSRSLFLALSLSPLLSLSLSFYLARSLRAGRPSDYSLFEKSLTTQLPCCVCGSNPLSLELIKARTHQIGEPKQA